MGKIVMFPKNEKSAALEKVPRPAPPRGRVVLRILKKAARGPKAGRPNGTNDQ